MTQKTAALSLAGLSEEWPGVQNSPAEQAHKNAKAKLLRQAHAQGRQKIAQKNCINTGSQRAEAIFYKFFFRFLLALAIAVMAGR
jgi:hypothetical protein